MLEEYAKQHIFLDNEEYMDLINDSLKLCYDSDSCTSDEEKV